MGVDSPLGPGAVEGYKGEQDRVRRERADQGLVSTNRSEVLPGPKPPPEGSVFKLNNERVMSS